MIGIIFEKVEKMKNNEIYNIKKFKIGQIVEGEVVAVTDNEILVDFQYATEGKFI